MPNPHNLVSSIASLQLYVQVIYFPSAACKSTSPPWYFFLQLACPPPAYLSLLPSQSGFMKLKFVSLTACAAIKTGQNSFLHIKGHTSTIFGLHLCFNPTCWHNQGELGPLLASASSLPGQISWHTGHHLTYCFLACLNSLSIDILSYSEQPSTHRWSHIHFPHFLPSCCVFFPLCLTVPSNSHHRIANKF